MLTLWCCNPPAVPELSERDGASPASSFFMSETDRIPLSSRNPVRLFLFYRFRPSPHHKGSLLRRKVGVNHIVKAILHCRFFHVQVLRALLPSAVIVKRDVIMNTDAETPPLAAWRSVVPLFSNKSSGMMQYPQFTDRYTFS